MAILFAGSALSDFTNVTSYVTNTTDPQFLAEGVKEGIRIGAGAGSFDSAFQEATEFWLAFNFDPEVFTGNTASQDNSLVVMFNSSYSLANGIFRIKGTDAAYSLQFWNGASYTTIGTVNGINADFAARWDIHVKISDTDGVFEIYKNGSLVGPAAPVDTSLVAGVTGIDLIRLQNPTQLTSGVVYFSGVIVSSTDTRGLMLIQTQPIAAGEQSGWTGTYADVDETGATDTDFITSDTVDSVITFDFGTVPTTYDAMDVEAVVLSMRAQSGGGAATSVEGVARISGTNYAQPVERPLPPTYGPAQAIFNTNPATTAQWTMAQAKAAEYGLKATA